MSFWNIFRAKPKVPKPFLFENSESFRLCTEALKAFQQWEKKQGSIESALAKFKLATEKYPNDLFPRMYYAILLAQSDAPAAVTQWEYVIAHAPEGEMRQAARTNIQTLSV